MPAGRAQVILFAFSQNFMAHGREFHEQKQLDWLLDDAVETAPARKPGKPSAKPAKRPQEG
jgi:hypothetical protein